MSYSAGRGGRGGGPDRGRGGGRGGYRGGRGGGRTDLSQDMGRMNLGDRPVQRGPSGGGGGRPQTQGGPGGGNSIELCTNYFSVDTQPDWIIYQYCITFTPEVADKNVRKRLLYFHKEVIGPRKVFDGRMLYLPKLLPQVEMQVMYQMKDGTTGHIDIKRTNELTPQSTQCVQIYNIIMRTMLHDLELKEIGRNFYMPDSYVSVPKHSLDVLAGFATSIQQCMGGLKLCIDTSFKVLCQRTALHDLYEIYDDAMKRKQDFQKMCRAELPGKIVITRYNNRTYTIEDVDFDQNPYSTFKTGDGKEMRYADYMMQQHSLKINDDKQPLLITKADRKSGKQLTLIPECCNLTGIPERMKSDVFVMKDLAVHTRLNPENRNDKLLTFVKRLNSHPKCSADLKGWQIKIPTETVKIMATILKPETLHLADGFTTSYNSYKADWTREIRDKKFMVAKHFQNWVLLTDGSSERFVADFLKTLQRVCPGMGIKVDQPDVLNVGRGSAGDYTNGLRDVLGKGLPNLVVCLLPRNMADVYNAIKKVCYVQFGVPNQCIVAKTIKNPKSIMTCTTKIAMLASIKMGAELWHTNIPLGNMMVVGIDSYHDSAAKGRSVSAFVCSVNRTMSKYYSKMCFNHQYGELLDGIASCMAAGLQAYQRHNKELPQRIVIYRDGVGDGQLKSVKEYELAQFELACKNVGESYKPEITLVVCQKRVNARFSCQTNQGLGNPPPGTVIADNVTRPDWDDFFLISQSVSQGTVGPTHYVIVHAGVQALTKERLYMLTYKLCHMYYNWLGTVQVPAPCQYAHKMAYMVGSSLHAEPHQNMVETLFYL